MQKYKKIFVITRKIGYLFLIFLIISTLSGCTKKSEEIVLSPVDGTIISNEGSSKDVLLNDSSMNDNTSDSAMDTDKESHNKSDSGSEDMSDDFAAMYVHVCGAVVSEGVYELAAGSRVIDAVNAAGGFDAEADTEYVNQAAEVSDGLKIRIPYLRETKALEGSGLELETMSLEVSPKEGGLSGDHKKGGLLNINTATSDELCELPGIGPGYAQRIISYRQEEGSFSAIEDIMKVKGIKDKLFSRIKDLITV